VIPDRSPDSIVTRPAERRRLVLNWTCGVVPGHSHLTEAEAKACIDQALEAERKIACPDCGRSPTKRLGLLEALEVNVYAKSACPKCLLTDMPRARDAS